MNQTHKDLGPLNPCADQFCPVCFPEREVLAARKEATERFEQVMDIFSANFQTPWLLDDMARIAKWRAIITRAVL